MATVRKKRSKHLARVYWPNCAVCQYLKKNKDVRYRMMQSTYFNPQGSESLMDVVHAYGDPFGPSTVYAHMRRHQAKDLIKAERMLENYEDNKINKGLVDNTVSVIEASVESTDKHEIGLDQFIAEGRDKLVRGEMQVSATTFLQAIKIKADIQKSTKDRRLDAMKAMFSGASGREQ